MANLFFEYISSLTQFWGSVFRIGLPQILLIVLVIWWLKRKRCGQGSEDGCCVWTFGNWCCCRQDACRREPCCQDAAEEAHEAEAETLDAEVADEDD